AVAPGGRSHSPTSVLLPFDRADLVEDQGLVMAHLFPAAEGAGVGFGKVHIQDITRLDLPPDRDPVDGDRHLLALTRPVEALLPASDRLDPAEGPSILTHRSEEHTSELQSRGHLVCRLLLEKKKKRSTSRG